MKNVLYLVLVVALATLTMGFNQKAPETNSTNQTGYWYYYATARIGTFPKDKGWIYSQVIKLPYTTSIPKIERQFKEDIIANLNYTSREITDVHVWFKDTQNQAEDSRRRGIVRIKKKGKIVIKHHFRFFDD
jgi:hypothetical protein